MNRKLIFFVLFFLTICFTINIKAEHKLRFRDNGTFKIVQFTDVHYRPSDPNSKSAIENIENILDIEKPDLVIITGDIIWGKPAIEALDAIKNKTKCA